MLGLAEAGAEEGLFWKGSQVGQLWFWAAGWGSSAWLPLLPLMPAVVRHDFLLPCWDVPTCSVLAFASPPHHPATTKRHTVRRDPYGSFHSVLRMSWAAFHP